nr:MAG TPA: hypothetical protein [Caudoviricetes sp.]
MPQQILHHFYSCYNLFHYNHIHHNCELFVLEG